METRKRGILIVDQNALLREGLCTLIRLQPDMDLVGAVGSGSEAVRLFRELRPQVVLMDLDLPDSGGLRSIREIREVDPVAFIIGLITHPADECADLALRTGARNVLTKERLNRDLVARIRECLPPPA